jgi:hypothetical protein
MNTKFTLSLLVMLFAFGMQAQVIFQDDFESFTAGDRVAQASTANWDTWSGAVGGAEDGTISDAQAASGVNSLYISGTNDVLLRLAAAPMTAGRYKVTFNMFVQENRYAYFNFLAQFNGANSSWATQSYFRPNGSCNTDAGGADVAQFNQPAGEWFVMTTVLDLGDDFGTIYHETGEVTSWKWSIGALGGDRDNTFEALNFYAWNTEGTPGYYIDDIVVEQVEKPGNEILLEAVLNSDNQVELAWTGSEDVTEYVVTNKGDVLTQTTDTTNTIVKPYPQLFDFKVGAHFNLNGYRFSENQSLELAGGSSREFVLFEVGTGTWCPNCPAAARGVDDMHSAGFDVGIIEYHGGGPDDYIIPVGTDRINYYGINAYPETFADGESAVLGGSFGGNLFTTFEGFYDTRKDRRVLYDFNMSVTNVGGNDYKIEVSAEELYSYFDGPANLRIALTESNIPENWQGLTELDFLLRDMYPDATGIEMDLSSGAQSYEYTFTLDPSYIKNNCEIVAFIQHDDTKEVLNGQVISMATVSGVNEALSAEIELLPNPVVDYIQINGLTDGEAMIYAQDGKLVHRFDVTSMNHQESLTTINTGYYVLKVNTEEGIVSKQFIKK